MPFRALLGRFDLSLRALLIYALPLQGGIA
jgi:hypothetical protein